MSMLDVDLGGESIRSRAQAARRRSEEERARAWRLGGLAAALGRGSSALCLEHRRGTSRRLEWETQAADDGLVAWPVMREFVELDAHVVGRDLVIEEAKTVLCDQYGIGRGEAFAILRRASSHSNRKVRDVARGLVDASHTV